MAGEEPEGLAAGTEGGGGATDTAHLHLYRIGNPALLERGEEVALTRGIRERLEERDRAIVESPFMWRQIVSWAELLESGEMTPKELMPRGRRTRAELAAMRRRVRAAARLMARGEAEVRRLEGVLASRGASRRAAEEAGAGLTAVRARLAAAAEGLGIDRRRIERLGRRIEGLALAACRARSRDRRRKLLEGLPVAADELARLARRLGRLDALIDGAKGRMVEANLRLVFSIAKARPHHGMELGDLIQEGALGLLTAAERYDYRKGFKFSTYASWWILQAISRAVADKSSLIRMPAHLHERRAKVRRAVRRFEERHGRTPEPRDISRGVGLPLAQVGQALLPDNTPVSLSTPLFWEAEDRLESFVADPTEPSVEDSADAVMRRLDVERCLARLDPKEAEVLRRRFGLTAQMPATLDDVGRSFGVSRERIRQIEVQAIAKLRRSPDHRVLREYA